MSEAAIDDSKRRFLLTATSVVGGVATAAALVPFVASMMPSERAKAAGAPVEVDVSKIEAGSYLTVEWRGKPVWIVNRTKEMLDLLPKNDDRLADPNSDASVQPEYAKNISRAMKERENLLVVLGVCTHLGCSPSYRKEVGPTDFDSDWPGGFFCPCHGSKFDMAARVFRGVPAPSNLEIPPHKYLSPSLLLVGEDAKTG